MCPTFSKDDFPIGTFRKVVISQILLTSFLLASVTGVRVVGSQRALESFSWRTVADVPVGSSVPRIHTVYGTRSTVVVAAHREPAVVFFRMRSAVMPIVPSTIVRGRVVLVVISHISAIV